MVSFKMIFLFIFSVRSPFDFLMIVILDNYASGDPARVSTPTATETMLPWKRGDEGNSGLKQSEFPSWASNKEYLAYNSPSATFLGNFLNT